MSATATRPAKASRKTTCPVTLAQFRAGAKPIDVVINGVPMQAEVKEFSTGSFGWFLTGKTMLPVGDTRVSVQIGLNLIIVGSKEAGLDPETGEPLAR